MTYREVGAETVVNQPKASPNEGIGVSVGLVGGGTVVLYQSFDGDVQSDVLARIYDASGTPVGAPFTILNDYVAFELPHNVDVIALPNGGFAVASIRIQSLTSSGSSNTSDITLQYFSATGAATSGVISVSTLTGTSSTYVSEPSLSLAGNKLVVAWDGGSGPDGVGAPLNARSYDLSGNAATGIVTVESGSRDINGSTVSYDSRSPEVAGFSDGHFITTWRDLSTDSGDIRARLFDAAGNPLGTSFVVNGATAGLQTLPHVSVLANNQAIVTWGDVNGGTLVLKGQLLSSSGAKIGGEFVIDDTQLTGDTNLNDYGLTALSNGGFVVTWRDHSDDRVYVREYDSTGAALRAATAVSDGQGFFPTVHALPAGGYTLAWSASNLVYTQKVIDVPVNTHADFNGDGRSDVVVLDAQNTLTIYQGQSNGSFTAVTGLAANALDTNWKIVGLGDFNGDGKDDILWRHSSGEIGEWIGTGGVFANNGGAAANPVDNSWKVIGIADYNGDGRADILWRHTSGEIGQWVGTATGGFNNNGGAAANVVDNSWTVVASGDFNGDGKADILWQHSSGVYAEWIGSATGKLINAGQVMNGATGTVVGSGDFNGDGRDDVLIRNATSGQITEWLGSQTGQFTAISPALQLTELNYKVSSIGDFNGDGIADLLWTNSAGQTVEWLGSASGQFGNNGAALTLIGTQHIQSPDLFMV